MSELAKIQAFLPQIYQKVSGIKYALITFYDMKPKFCKIWQTVRGRLHVSLGSIFVLFMILVVVVPEIYSMVHRKSVNEMTQTITKIEPYNGEFSKTDVISRPLVNIEVNIPAKEMTLYEDGVELFKRKVAIGQAIYPTPEHAAAIQVIEWNPWWYPPKTGWAKKDKPTPPGPKNPLGPVKLRIGKYGDILMHGTDKSWSVGRPASHGCMRMFNEDAKDLAWYLQRNFSQKNDPALIETYSARNKVTFRVNLDSEIPVKLVYEPVIVADDSLKFYPDVYNKFKNRKKSAILTQLMKHGINLGVIDDRKIEALVKDWPANSNPVPIEDLLFENNNADDDLLSAPECS
jgi:hypothetical protein